MTATDPLVVTRHPALVEYLRERELVDGDVPVITHATVEDVRDRHVIGVLPLWLAAEAASVTEVRLNIPAVLRGEELSVDQIRRFAQATVTYRVTTVRTEEA